jgi:hypothetical protein
MSDSEEDTRPHSFKVGYKSVKSFIHSFICFVK